LSVFTGCTVLRPESPDEPLQEEPSQTDPQELEVENTSPENDEKEDPILEVPNKPSSFIDESGVYIKVMEDNNQQELTKNDERIIAIRAVLDEALRHANDMQAITPEEKSIIWHETYRQSLIDKHGEPYEELMVRNAKERNWNAETTDESVEFIALTQEGFALARLHWTITYTSGDFDGLDFGYELNRPYQKTADIRLVSEENAWKITEWVPVEITQN